MFLPISGQIEALDCGFSRVWLAETILAIDLEGNCNTSSGYSFTRLGELLRCLVFVRSPERGAATRDC